MQERLQFLCGAASLLLWMVTFLFVVGYADHATVLRFSWTTTGRPGALTVQDVFSGAESTWANASRTALAALGCDQAPAPLCACVGNASLVARTQCAAAGAQAITNCFFTARKPTVTTELATGTRPYMWLLAANCWAALVGTTLLVKSKLLDRGSFAVQLMVQLLLATITVGTQWVMFGAPPEEWAVTLGVCLALIVLGWWGGDDEGDWWVYHLSLLYIAVLPTLCVVYNAYNQRRDVVYMVGSVSLSLSVALIAAVRHLLERSRCGEHVDDPLLFCDTTLKILTLALVGFSYDADTVHLLETAIPAFWVYAIYLGLSFAPAADAGFVYMAEVGLRFVLSLCMLNELYEGFT